MCSWSGVRGLCAPGAECEGYVLLERSARVMHLGLFICPGT